MFHRADLVGDIDFQHKFGGGFNIEPADLPIDIWDFKGQYPFPVAGNPTTLVCGNEEDGPGGIGALTVSVFGLDDDLKLLTSVVTADGLNEVNLPAEYYRVFRVNIETAGSYETNVSNVDIRHGPTLLARVLPDHGSTLMATYTVSLDYQLSYLKKLYLDVSQMQGERDSIVMAYFQSRKLGGAWQVKHPVRLATSVGFWDYTFSDPGLSLSPGSDLRWRIVDISSSTISAFAGFDLREVK